MSHRLPVADIQFISDFAAFCRMKGDEGFDYCAPDCCALAQFLRASGRAQNPSVGGYAIWTDEAVRYGRPQRAPGGVHEALLSVLDLNDFGTFSALADRLEDLIADAPEVERV